MSDYMHTTFRSLISLVGLGIHIYEIIVVVWSSWSSCNGNGN